MAAPLKLSVIIEAIDKTMAIGQADERVKRFAASARSAALGVTMIGGAIVAAIGKGVSEFAKFEKAMAEVSTLVDTTQVNIENLTDEVRELALVSGEAPEQLARGLYQAVSAGVAAGESMEFLGLATRAAIGGVTDTFTAVDGLTTMLNAYGLQASDATRISDEMFTAVKQGKTTFGELSGTIGTVAAIAAQAGMSTKELFAAISTLTAGGINTDTAITALRATLTSILSPTSMVEAAAAKLGIQWDLQALQTKGLQGMMLDLQRATGGDASAMAELVPNVRALVAVMGLAGMQAGKFAEDLQAQEGSAGAAATAYEKMETTVSRRMARLREVMRSAWLEIGEAAMPLLEKLIPKVSTLIESITKWADAHPWLTEKIVGTAGAIGGLMVVVGPLLWMLPGMIRAWELWNSVLAMNLLATTKLQLAWRGTQAGLSAIPGYALAAVAGLLILRKEYDLIAGAAERAVAKQAEFLEKIKPVEAPSFEEWLPDWEKQIRESRGPLKDVVRDFAWTIVPQLKTGASKAAYVDFLAGLPSTPEVLGKAAAEIAKTRLVGIRDLKKEWQDHLGLLKLYQASQGQITQAEQALVQLTEQETYWLTKGGDKAGLLTQLTEQRAIAQEEVAAASEQELLLAQQKVEMLRLLGGSQEEMVAAQDELNQLIDAEIRSLWEAGEYTKANAMWIERAQGAEQERQSWLQKILDIYRQITGEQEGQEKNLRRINRAEEWMLGLRRGITGGPKSLELYAPREGQAGWIERTPTGRGAAATWVGNLYLHILADGTAELSPGQKQWIQNFSYEIQRQAVLGGAY